MSPALDFVKQTCQQDAKRNNEMAPILQSIMQDDEEFKRGWLGIKGVGDKIFDLTPHGRNIPRRKEEQEVFCVTTWFDILMLRSDGGRFIGKSLIRKPMEYVFHQKNKICCKMVCRERWHSSRASTGDRSTMH
ncbi:hypothetical protein Tco_0917872 [Tanacetum coccineum]